MHKGIDDLKNERTNSFNAIPYGVSIATPSKIYNSTVENTNSVTVLVNQMVNDNIN